MINDLRLKKMNILGVDITVTSKEEIHKYITNYLKQKYSIKPLFIVTPNPEQIVYAQKNEQFRKILNSADIALPDGVGLKLANSNLKIIKGREFMGDLIKLAQIDKLKIFFLGGSEDANELATALTTMNFPQIRKVAGMTGPILNNKSYPINQKEVEFENKAINLINSEKPDILFVAFGAPKQEFWIARYQDKINVKVIMSIGGAINYLAGISWLPPKAVAGFGLEWLWRLIHEPWRIKRQLSLLKFVYLVWSKKS